MNRFDDWKQPADDNERAKAEQLRRAIDEAGAGAGVESELEVAALMRANVEARGTLSGARADAVWARIAGAAAATNARRRKRWLYGGLSAAAAAAAVVVLLLVGDRRADSTRMPAPGIALLKAQTDAAARGKSIAGLGDEMRTYRDRMYAALAERYRETR